MSFSFRNNVSGTSIMAKWTEKRIRKGIVNRLTNPKTIDTDQHKCKHEKKIHQSSGNQEARLE